LLRCPDGPHFPRHGPYVTTSVSSSLLLSGPRRNHPQSRVQQPRWPEGQCGTTRLITMSLSEPGRRPNSSRRTAPRRRHWFTRMSVALCPNGSRTLTEPLQGARERQSLAPRAAQDGGRSAARCSLPQAYTRRDRHHREGSHSPLNIFRARNSSARGFVVRSDLARYCVTLFRKRPPSVPAEAARS